MQGISGARTLHRLIYASRQTWRPGQDPDQEVNSLVETSVRNNQAASLTGLLLVHGGWFVQVLEGPAESVMTTYRRILDDPRHSEPRVIFAGPAEAREFGDWNMCARRLSKADNAILETLQQRGGFDPSTLSAPSALRLLTAVRGIQQRAGAARVA